MKIKNVLLMGLSLVLVAVIAIGGTVAYLTDTDSDVNVMTLGNVKIAQHEYQRATDEDGSYKTGTIDEQNSYVLEDFEQGKPLLPFVGNYASGGWDATPVRMTQVGSYGGMNVLIGENAVDKFVTVENTGKTDAYVRTLVAIEYGKGNPDLIGRSYHFTWVENMVGGIEIDGNNYYLYEFVYNGADGVRHENGLLPAGDTSYPSLAQVYLKSEATNEDCAALDGNGNGALDILVLSQAVQAAGFENAVTALNAGFGEANAANAATWFGGTEIPVVVNSNDEFKAAVSNKASEIIVDNATLDLSAGIAVNGADITVNGGTVETTNKNYTGIQHSGVVTYNDVTFNGATFLYGEKVVFNNCEFNLTTNYVWTYGAKEVVFNNCTFNTDGKAILIFQDGTTNDQVVTVKDCTFNATKTAQTASGVDVAAVSIDGTNGTYVVNFEGTNTVDNDFNGLYQIKAGADNVTINE